MKTCSKCKEQKSLSDYYKDKRAKDGLYSCCKTCFNLYYETSKPRILASAKRRYNENPEKYIEKSRAYYYQNREMVLEYRRCYDKIYRSNNKGLVSARGAKRRAKKLQATPCWADDKKIQAVYAIAKWLSSVVPNHKYHVDHVIPLQGKNCSGLHVHNNLAVIKDYENFSKSNKFEIE